MENSSDNHLNSHPEIDRWDILLMTICFLSSFALYLRTLSPGLLPGDSGEFQTLAYLMGHTHPTGYPIYLTLARLVTFLPVGDIAYRVNLFSALMGALTVSGIYLSGRLLVNYRLLAFIGATALAISPTFWSQSIIAEVYTAGAAFFVFILLTLIWWDKNNGTRFLFLAGLLGGLSLGIHMNVVLLAPTVLLTLLFHWRRAKKMWSTAILSAVTGLLLTMLVFWLIDNNDPTANYFNSVIEPSHSAWELTVDEIDGPMERLLFGWSARQFRSFMFADIINVMPEQAAEFWQILPVELGWPLVFLAMLGAANLIFHRARAGIFLISSLLVQLIFVFNYEIWDLYVFYIPSYILIALLSISGMGALVDLGMNALRRIAASTQIRWGGLAMEGVVALLVFGSAIYPTFHPQKEAVIKGEVPFEFDEYPVYNGDLQDLAVAFVVNLPENTFVFTDWDMIWPYYYAANIVENRSDLAFIETYPADDIDGIADSMISFVSDHIGTNLILFNQRESALLDAGFKFAPARFGPVRLFQVLDDK